MATLTWTNKRFVLGFSTSHYKKEIKEGNKKKIYILEVRTLRGGGGRVKAVPLRKKKMKKFQ